MALFLDIFQVSRHFLFTSLDILHLHRVLWKLLVEVKARSSSLNRLELRFRPEDPYCHPAFGDLHVCENTFLLKISKRSNASSDSSATKTQDNENNLGARQLGNQSETSVPSNTKEDQAHLCADVVTRISEAYSFKGMVDYQHVVAVHAENSRRKKRSWSEVEQQKFEKIGFMDMDNEDVMLLVPPLFSIKDVPSSLALSRPPVALNMKRSAETLEDSFQVFTEKSVALDFRIKDILICVWINCLNIRYHLSSIRFLNRNILFLSLFCA
ncbi:hypothetical protein SAY86_027606 [Trapa natans]|uniref:Transcription factor IIIC subunit Tfc1/Sfc1 triple barrel domain-containing protein n=1 Tax=Trapa natans TaxID=22666 RepID=A0AAN7QJI7_TRANT|nr:hypothetical protein SAY86_027606 [Trapa natans]